ncbi:MAG: putative lipid carrier protein [Rhodospirillaceae bacterium]|nr:MAG: putative lipid carrier protein [Rhodospirillaceae bacterium]
MIDTTRAAPFSLFLCAGLAVRPVPLAPLQGILTALLHLILHERPALFAPLHTGERLVYLIDPVDFPFVFVFEPTKDPPVLRVQRDGDGVQPSATITTPFEVLFDLLAGKIDGDAVFFSRALTIGGDTAAVVALSNVLDGAEIDLGPMVADRCGPLAGFMRTGLAQGEQWLRRMDADMRWLATNLLTPLERRFETGISSLADRLAALEEGRENFARSRHAAGKMP